MGGGWFIWVIVIVLIGLGFSYFAPRRGAPSRRGDDALDVERRRLARGEISNEEFEEKKKRLRE